MAGGTWSPTEEQVLPGLFLNFEAAALAAIQPGARGIVAMPVRANWGPVGQFVTITREGEIKNAYTYDMTNGANAYDCIRLALLGGAKEVHAYRIVGDGAAQASVMLMDTAGAAAMTLTTNYPTERAFNVTVQDNLVDNTKLDIKLFEGTTLLWTWTVAKGSLSNMVAAINNNSGNVWVTAAKPQGASDTAILKAVSAQPFAGGNSGNKNITNAVYVNAQAAFEREPFNLFTLDGVTDPATLISFASWTIRNNNEGKFFMTVFGGTVADDMAVDSIARANARSATYNHETVINVGNGAILAGTAYSSAMLACYVAGAIAGQKLSESVTYFATPFSDVTRRPSISEKKSAVKGGTLIFDYDGESVKILRGMNTLIQLRQKQNNQFKKIRAIRVMQSIDDDLLKNAEKNYIGKVNNDDEGRDALVAAWKVYMRTLAKGGVIERKGWDVWLDPDYHGLNATMKPEADQVYPLWSARITDVVEQVFGRFLVQ